MLRWMCDKIRMDKFRKEEVRRLVGVAPIEDKMRTVYDVWPHMT